MVKYFIFLLSLLILFCNCGNNKKDDLDKTLKMLPQDTLTRMVVAVNNLNLRGGPGNDQPSVEALKKGTTLETTGAISPLKTSILIRGVQREEPWIEVRTPEGVKGWIFGGGVKIEGAQNTPVASVLRKERLSNFFDPEKTRQILQYRTDFFALENPRDFENVFIRGTILRDSLVNTIREKIEIMDHENLPDLSWLEDAMPGFALGMIAEGTSYYLFQDYGKMKLLAKETTDMEDDRFFEFISLVNSGEDIEDFYPIWFEQTWDYGGFSLLGTGKHLLALDNMEQLMAEQQLFSNPILKLKMKLLSDILYSPSGAYSESAEKIIEEIDAILSKNFKILSVLEKNNLEKRKTHFLDPTKYGLKLNLKSTNS